MLIAGVIFTLTAAGRGEITAFDWESVPDSAWWAIGYLIGMGSIVAYSSYIWLLQVRPATEVSTHTYVNPIVAVLLGAWFAHETVTYSQVVALLVILGSVFLINWDAYKISGMFSRRKNRSARIPKKVRRQTEIRSLFVDSSTKQMRTPDTI